jgi:cell division protein FtsB
VRKVLADMHVPPALRRWSIRVALATVVALVVTYVPWRMSGGGDRADRLSGQLEQIRGEARELEAENARLEREIHALRTEPAAIEDHARDELGMVYPGELVLRVEAPPAEEASP